MDGSSLQSIYTKGSQTSPLAILSHQIPHVPFLSAVKESKTHTYFGPFSQLLAWLSSSSSLKSIEGNHIVFSILSNTDASNPVLVRSSLLNFLEQAATDCQHSTDCCWLDIRMSKPLDDFKIPRWHQDGNYFAHDTLPPTAQPRSKWATTIFGPSTLFLDLDFSDKDICDYIGNQDDSSEWRAAQGDDEDGSANKKRVNDYLRYRKGGEIVKVDLGQVVRFGYGQLESPVHSEPDMSWGDRVFVSVMFGMEKELKELCVRWKGKWEGGEP